MGFNPEEEGCRVLDTARAGEAIGYGTSPFVLLAPSSPDTDAFKSSTIGAFSTDGAHSRGSGGSVRGYSESLSRSRSQFTHMVRANSLSQSIEMILSRAGGTPTFQEKPYWRESLGRRILQSPRTSSREAQDKPT